jgi:hypothetical protein
MTQLAAKVLVVETNLLQIWKDFVLANRLPPQLLIVHGTDLAEIAVAYLQSPPK